MSYRTIVADPPWPMVTRGGYSWRKGARSGEARELDYPPMSIEAITQLGVESVAANEAHLWLWVPGRHLEHAPGIVRAWGFTPLITLVWSKPPFGWNPGGDFASVCEFIIYARRGQAKAKRRMQQQVFTWSRPLYARGAGRDGHSVKPEPFYDLVESMTHGPFLELFARRGRLGWDAAGDEALATVEVAGVANA